MKIAPLTTKQIALVAVFAALQAVLGLLPFTIAIGVSGTITLGVIGGPLIGIVLGPFLGGLSCLIGSLISVFVNPAGAIFGILTILPPTLGAVGAGSVMLRKGYFGGSVILGSLAIFYAHPYGREASLFPWLHIIAFIVALVFSTRIAFFDSGSSRSNKFSLTIPIAAFVGTLTDNMFGNALAIWYFNPYLTPDVWNVLIFVYPLERIVAVILISIVGIPLLYSLRKAGLLGSSR